MNFLIPVEEKHQLVAQPGHKLAIPLFLLTSLLYFGTFAYDYFTCCQNFDKTFGWFGGFYVLLGSIYLITKFFKKD